MLIKSPENIKYFTDFNTDFGYILIKKDDDIFFTDARYFESASKISKINTQLFKGLESLKDFLEDTDEIFIETDKMTVEEFQNLQKIFPDKKISKQNNISVLIKNLRRVKNNEEKNNIFTAQKIAERALEKTLNEIKVGITEKELAAKLEYNMSMLGSEKPSFETIVLFNQNTSVPHGVPSDNRLLENDIILIDFGAVYNGYHSDMTRTILWGDKTDKVKKMYELVLKVQQKCIEKAKVGVKVSDLYDLAVAEFKDKAIYFTHSLGHGVGLEIHESPNLSNKSNQVLEVGDIITIEPGLYFENEFGIRIEDMIYIGKNESENLTNFPK
ncbi:MAG: Xaa-Pro peptidase family protein [Clostridia bacterium]|nr:Xaa-Pro peptidase family protein [Clostridia bacterium]